MVIEKRKYRKGQLYSFYRRVYRKTLGKDAPYKRINKSKVLCDPSSVNVMLQNMILSGEPFMIARYGSVELSTVVNYLQKTIGDKETYDAKTINALCLNAGFFPRNENLTDKFAELMIESSSQLDVIGLWNNNQENYVVETFSPHAKGVMLYCLEPYYNLENAWVHALKGKRILVIHPFAESIKKQFEKRQKLFDDNFWPEECTLKTIKAVQTIAGEKDERFSTWFDALEYMKEQVSKEEFDIAIIGCGAYGFPLAAYIKQIGKQAIHLGGATQMLFGICGKRWDDSKLKRFYNSYWVRPDMSEIPKNSNKVEEGCYW